MHFFNYFPPQLTPNHSLELIVFPSAQKLARVMPTLLQQVSWENYWLFFNLVFLSKLLKWSTRIQLIEYMDINYVFCSVQSAYHTKHSTEAAIIKILIISYCYLTWAKELHSSSWNSPWLVHIRHATRIHSGAVKFLTHMVPVCDTGVGIHQYADDKQLYITFYLDRQDDAVAMMEACVSDIWAWRKWNKLKLNED